MEKMIKSSKWAIYQFRDKQTNDDAFVIAGSQEFAELKIKQSTTKGIEFVKSLPIEQIDRSKAWIILNNIKTI